MQSTAVFLTVISYFVYYLGWKLIEKFTFFCPLETAGIIAFLMKNFFKTNQKNLKKLHADHFTAMVKKTPTKAIYCE